MYIGIYTYKNTLLKYVMAEHKVPAYGLKTDCRGNRYTLETHSDLSV